MPPVFAQPAPARALSDISRSSGGDGGENLRAYTQLAGILQQRYASDAASNAREGLGYAQLEADTLLRSRALGIQEAELAQRSDLTFGAIRARANAETEQWIAQQRFTLQDRQELTRQENALGELVSKRETGEISDSEFYRMAGKVAPRINALQAKDQHNKVKAQTMALEELASQRAEAKKNQEYLNALNSGELESRIDYHVDPAHENDLSRIMRYGHPELKQGTPEYDAMRKMEAAKQGWATPMVKEGNKLVPLTGGRGAGGAGQGQGQTRGQVTEHDRQVQADRAVDKARKSLSDRGNDNPSSEELLAEAKKHMDVVGQLTGGAEKGAEAKAKTAERHKAQIGKVSNAIDKLQSSTDVGDVSKKFVMGKLVEIRDTLSAFHPGEPIPESVRARVEKLQSEVEQYDLYRAEAARTAREVVSKIKIQFGEPSRIQRGLDYLGDVFSFQGAPVEGK